MTRWSRCVTLRPSAALWTVRPIGLSAGCWGSARAGSPAVNGWETHLDAGDLVSRAVWEALSVRLLASGPWSLQVLQRGGRLAFVITEVAIATQTQQAHEGVPDARW